VTSLWSDPISRGIVPVRLDLNFERPEDKAWPFRHYLSDQYFLCPEVGPYPRFVFPLPLGFRTDGPSIPWWMQWAVPKDGPIWPASQPHDVACAGELFAVDICNQIMGLAMEHSPVTIPPRHRRRAQWAVDNFCWITFRAHTPADVAADRALVLQASRDLWRRKGHLFEGYARIEEISPAYGMAA
jgi:hypothetical protein